MIVRFTVTEGEDKGTSFDLKPYQAWVFGRSVRSNVPIHDVNASRRHFEATNDGSRCVIRDLSSKNGTYVNGVAISTPTELHDNDAVTVGVTTMRVDVVTATAADAVVAVVRAGRKPEIFTPVAPPDGGFRMADASLVETTAGGSARGIMERFSDLKTATVPAVGAPAADTLIGKIIGGFRVERRAGEDAISLIYEARQLSMDRIVTLRVLRASMTGDQAAVQRFIAAARAGGRLVHPHIVQVYDAGNAEGVFYIALEHVDGRTVSDVVQPRGAGAGLPLMTVLKAGSQIAGALEYAHTQQIVHGRIRPQVIFLTRHGIAKIAELGFVRALEESGLPHGSEPASASDFMAPEQFDTPPTTDARSDLYSLGAVLYFMLSGQPPFAAGRDAAARRAVPAPLSQIANLPEPVAEVVARAMAPTPAARPVTALDLQQELNQLMLKMP